MFLDLTILIHIHYYYKEALVIIYLKENSLNNQVKFEKYY